MVSRDDRTKRKAPLDPFEHVSEVVFGVLMALSFTGALSVATAGREEVRTMMLTALGCNIAWGLTDAVMYLVGTATERERKVALLRRLAATKDAGEAHRMIAGELPGPRGEALEAMRQSLLAVPIPSANLGRDDFAAALGVFFLVVLATFPVVIPFVFLHETALALRVSNGLAVATLFVGGYMLGRHAEGNPWRFGLALAVIGAALVAAIVALGG